MRKKILYVITKSNFGGAQRYVYDLATSLPARDYEVVVAYGGTGGKRAALGALHTKLNTAGIRTMQIRHFMRDMSLLDDMRALWELVMLFRDEKPDIAHVTSSKAGGLGVAAARIARIPVIVFTSHGLAYDESWRPWWQRAAILLFTWLTILLSTRTIQISSDTAERASGLPFVRKKVVLVKNGIDTPSFVPRLSARSALRGALNKGSEGHEMWIGTIGELHPNKNQEVLVRALALLHEQGIRPHLWLLGDGDERTRLERLTREAGLQAYVHFPGYVQNAATFLQALDVFVLPSKKEGLPYVLLEAGLAQLPVIVSNITGNKDIVEHRKTGLVVSDSAEAYAEAIKELLRDTKQSQAYANALHQHVTQHFSIKKMREATVACYKPSKPSISRSMFSRRTERS